MINNSKNFEENIKRLEQIVHAMEQGDVPLEESLKLFQEGTELVERCGKLLDDAEMKIKKIIPGDDGKPVEVEFINAEGF